ncbi:hypothetical protein KP509_28G025000 [Ceratopteris richardii]|uniref:Uncharacterized protein n=1 Tax=Ceratopteris richardii TaxID=49495 RepID=A0A8T2RD05_CERRI|nr:hypothetical protein KP509_28G025000 [Ceratopteris richardii]
MKWVLGCCLLLRIKLRKWILETDRMMSFLGSLRKRVIYSLQSLSVSKKVYFTPHSLYFPEEIVLPSWVLLRYPGYGQEFGIQRQFKSAPLQERKMIDRRRVHVKGGDGGDGCTSFRKSRHDRHGEADGGRGGRGGDVIFKCTDEFWDFSHLQHHYNAGRGGHGSSKKRVGSRGLDKEVLVPKGTVIHLVSGQIPSLQESSLQHSQLHDDGCTPHEYSEADEVDEEELSDTTHEADSDNEDDYIDRSGMESESAELDYSSGVEASENDELMHRHCTELKSSVAELLKVGEKLTVACGGEGGRGNAAMARGRGSKKQLPSKEHEKGHPGTDAFLILELKTIADVGFVGAPNAGKSTLLGAISRAKPKVGHYAFTTLRPNLGKLEFEDFYSITVADIPGLIKGAHRNVGLGHDFLRHIERTKVLAYVVDLSASLGVNKGSPPWIQFEDLKYELEMYQPGLSERPSLVVATKLDEQGATEMLEQMREKLPSVQIIPVCALLEQGIHELRVALREIVEFQNT